MELKIDLLDVCVCVPPQLWLILHPTQGQGFGVKRAVIHLCYCVQGEQPTPVCEAVMSSAGKVTGGEGRGGGGGVQKQWWPGAFTTHQFLLPA